LIAAFGLPEPAFEVVELTLLAAVVAAMTRVWKRRRWRVRVVLSRFGAIIALAVGALPVGLAAAVGIWAGEELSSDADPSVPPLWDTPGLRLLVAAGCYALLTWRSRPKSALTSSLRIAQSRELAQLPARLDQELTLGDRLRCTMFAGPSRLN
jgi:hypothetical protein